MTIENKSLSVEFCKLILQFQDMEFERKVSDELGEQTISVLMNEIRNGRLEMVQVKQIGLKMHGSVHGVFQQKINKHESLDQIFLQMLDTWHKSELHKPEVNSRERLFSILRDPSLSLDYLAQQIIEEEEESEILSSILSIFS